MPWQPFGSCAVSVPHSVTSYTHTWKFPLQFVDARTLAPCRSQKEDGQPEPVRVWFLCVCRENFTAWIHNDVFTSCLQVAYQWKDTLQTGRATSRAVKLQLSPLTDQGKPENPSKCIKFQSYNTLQNCFYAFVMKNS